MLADGLDVDGDGGETRSFEGWILDSMSSGIVAVDAAAALVVFNRGAQRILGCPEGDPGSALGRDCREVLASHAGVVRLLLETLERKSPLARAELRLDGRGGVAARTIGFTLCPVLDGMERVRGAAMIFRDLAPIERRDEQQRLHERLAALGQMAAGLAHEIRNPLAGMEVLAGLLKRRLGSRPAEQALVSDLAGELRTLSETVAASLDFVRPARPLLAPLDLRGILEESASVAIARTSFAGRVERDYEDSLPKLHADAEQLRAVLTNLVLNALEALSGPKGPGEPCLRLGLRARAGQDPPVRIRSDGDPLDAPTEAGKELEITVADNGPGVAPELREKIFYPFFTTKESGSGVGLAMAQKIVASHGGSIEIDAAPGGGSIFRVRLPVTPDAWEAGL